MKKKTSESFQEWAKEVQSKLSPEQKTHFDALIADEAEGVKVFGGVMAEREFYRHKNELNESEKALELERQRIAAFQEQLTRDAISLKNWYETVDDPVHTVDEILDGCPDALLLRRSERGRLRATGGG